MKNIIINFKYSVIALLLIFLNGVEAFASTPWTVNPSDYRYDMSIYLDVISFDAVKMDYSNYEVAVFCGEECRGVAERLVLDGENECLYLRARSNQEKGETMTFKLYNKATEEVLTIDGFSFEFESNGRLGYPSAPFIVKMGRYYDVILSAGPGGSIDRQSGLFVEGTELTITATPAEGYHFEKWSDGVTDNPRTIVVDGSINITAEFGVNSYKLIYMVDGEEYKVCTIAYGAKITPEAYPEKDDLAFSGWEGLPETMPAHDVTVTGTFLKNSYNAIFKIGDEVIGTVSVVCGEPIVAPEAPEKIGHTFAGWQDVPETMPARDIEIFGTYTVNSYKLIYMVDGEEYKVYTVAYGTEITPETPEKEGYTFSGWEGLPETMPARDVTVTGTFSINSYNVIFKTDDEVVGTVSVVYGQPIVVPEAPEKIGHTFAGWLDVPETMPAYDIEIFARYTVNSYKLIYKIDGEEYKVYTIDYGTEITHEARPEKEGYTFIGWGVAPVRMTAHDFIVRGSFIINSYTLRIYLNGELYHSEIVEYGRAVSIKESIVKDGMKFDGCINDIPEIMPAHDVDIYATYSGETSIASIKLDDDTNVTVGTLNGKILYKNEIWENVKDKLDKGIYIVNGVKMFIRK